jgi:hypothetical protein
VPGRFRETVTSATIGDLDRVKFPSLSFLSVFIQKPIQGKGVSELIRGRARGVKLIQALVVVVPYVFERVLSEVVGIVV